jgi:putative aldouronate transport system permease protein
MSIYDKSFGSRLFDVLLMILMVLIIFATLFPFYYIFIVSISNGNAVMSGAVKLLPVGLTLDSYKLAMANPFVPRSLLNSVVYTTVGTAISLFMTALCAYPLARPRFAGRTFFTWVVTLTMFFAGGLIPLYLLVLQLHLIDSIWAIVLPVAINPFNMFLMRTFFQGIHESIYEAGLLDGASELQILWKIVLPLSMPIFATLLLFYAVYYWNDFFNALIYLNDRLKYPIQLFLRNTVIVGVSGQASELAGGSDFGVVDMTLRYATIMISTVPILLVYPFVQRYFVKGVMIGAIKE